MNPGTNLPPAKQPRPFTFQQRIGSATKNPLSFSDVHTLRHDEYFRFVFGDPNTARNLLEHALPPPLFGTLDTSVVTVHRESYISPELRRSYTDLLVSVGAKTGPAARPSEALVYVLIEHKSYPDRWVGLQILRYMGEIWRSRRESHPQEHLLPQILPVVVSTAVGNRPPVDFHSLVNVEFEKARHTPQFELLYYDALGEPAHRTTLRFAAAIRVFQAAARSDSRSLRRAADALHRLWHHSEDGEEASFASIRYLMGAVGAEAKETFQTELGRSGFHEGEQEAMTIAEAIHKEGREEGLEQGELRSRRKILRRQLARKFDITDAEAERIEKTEDTAALDAALDAFAEGREKTAVLALLPDVAQRKANHDR